jgi:HlyD family secretion protein
MSNIVKLALVAPILAGVAAVGFYYENNEVKVTKATAASEASEPKLTWLAAAPGRVEPKTGEIHIRADIVGRVADILVNEGDQVVAGQLLVRLDDEAALAQLRKAEAEIEALEKRRNDAKLTRRSQKRRDAENDLSEADRALLDARRNLDKSSISKYLGVSSADDVQNASQSVKSVLQDIDNKWEVLRSIRKEQENPTSLPEEAALASARAQLSQAIAALEKTRIRAPHTGTVLDVDVKVGEILAPTSMKPAVVVGDISSLRVRAEVDERDVAKILLEQDVIIRADSFPNKDFSGKVSLIAASLGPAQLNKRGDSRPADATVLEVKIDVTGISSLLPGMEVDVLFSPKQVEPPNKKTARQDQ